MKIERVQAFSDGVFAILITILVLELKLPHYEEGHLLEAIAKQWPILLAYIVSYAYIGILWLFHHDLFNTIKRTTIQLNILNLISLFIVTLLNFSTVLVSESMLSKNTDDMVVAFCLYDGLAFFISFSYLLLYAYLSENETLLQEGTTYYYTKKALKYPLISMSIYLLAFITTFFYVYLGASLLLLGIIFHGYAYYKTAQTHRLK